MSKKIHFKTLYINDKIYINGQNRSNIAKILYKKLKKDIKYDTIKNIDIIGIYSKKDPILNDITILKIELYCQYEFKKYQCEIIDKKWIKFILN